MALETSDQYVCIAPTYKDGRLFAVGDILLAPPGTPLKNRNFVLQKAAETGDGGKTDAKRKKAKASEVED
jgi:hypothetical protein